MYVLAQTSCLGFFKKLAPKNYLEREIVWECLLVMETEKNFFDVIWDTASRFKYIRYPTNPSKNPVKPSKSSMVEPTDCKSVDCYTFLRNFPTVKFFPALKSHYISELSQTISHCICIWPQLLKNLQTKNHVKTQPNSI